VDGHELDSAFGARGGIGKRRQLVQCRVERRAEQVLLATRQPVEAAPQQVEVSARRVVHAAGAAQPQPDLLEPGSNRRRGLRGAERGNGFQGIEHPARSQSALAAEQRQPPGQQLGDGPRQQHRVVG